MTAAPCAILGATGMVGQRFLRLLHQHPEFAAPTLVGSARSQGDAYGKATDWVLDEPMPAAARQQIVIGPDDIPPGAVVFSALPSAIAGPLEPELRARGHPVFTNAGSHRMDADVPLLIPEVNPHDLAMVEQQSGPGFIVANGNCSGIILTLALAPIQRAFGIREAHVTTLQGLSGAGIPGLRMDLSGNVNPYIGGEEEKLSQEPQKTLGADFPIHATCTRVPVREGHTETVHLRLAGSPSAAEVKDAFASFRGPPAVAALPSAPERPIHVLDQPDRPQPLLDRDREGGMAVSVGRIRITEDMLQFVVLGHNTLRGAAGQSVLNAEFAKAQGRLDNL